MSEVRLIDANALKLMKVAECAGHTIEYAAGWKRCVEYCKNDAPTVDAVPVRHGHWEIVPNDHNTDSYYKMRCSVCGGTLWSIQSEELYCCKCGSKMDGADEERR